MSENTDTYTLAAQRLTEYMKGRNIRKTPERFEILRVICQIQGIFSIDDLQEVMEKKAKFQVSRVTLFNTMKLLEDAMLVIKHTLVRAAHYECCITPRPMVCLVCQKCGSVRKLESARLIRTQSAGVKGTRIEVLNDIAYDEFERIYKEKWNS